MDNEEKLTT